MLVSLFYFIIVVNVLLCLVYKLERDTCVYAEKTIVFIGFGTLAEGIYWRGWSWNVSPVFVKEGWVHRLLPEICPFKYLSLLEPLSNSTLYLDEFYLYLRSSLTVSLLPINSLVYRLWFSWHWFICPWVPANCDFPAFLRSHSYLPTSSLRTMPGKGTDGQQVSNHDTCSHWFCCLQKLSPPQSATVAYNQESHKERNDTGKSSGWEPSYRKNNR